MAKPRMLDLFCGRFGWGKVFAERGWEVVGVDLVEPPEIPEGCRFAPIDVLDIRVSQSGLIELPFLGAYEFDFICASSPCEQFSVHGMKHFHPNPPYPELGIKLFEHTRTLCEKSGVPYVMENVRAAQKFVGGAANHCGPYYLWGSGVPHALQRGMFGDDTPVATAMPKGIIKGCHWGGGTVQKQMSIEERREHRKKFPAIQSSHGSKERAAFTAAWATIPSELSNTVASYAERLLEKKAFGDQEQARE